MIILLLEWLFRLSWLRLWLSAIQGFSLALKHHACLRSLSEGVLTCLPLLWVLALVCWAPRLLPHWLKLKGSLVPLHRVAVTVQVAMWSKYLALVYVRWNVGSIESFLVADVHLIVLGSISASLIAHALLSSATFAWALASWRPWFFGVVFTWFPGVTLFRIGWVAALSGLVGVAVAKRSDRIGWFSWIGVAVLPMTGILWPHLHLRAGILPRG